MTDDIDLAIAEAQQRVEREHLARTYPVPDLSQDEAYRLLMPGATLSPAFTAKSEVDGVVVAYVRPTLIHGDFAEALYNLREYDATHHGRLAPGRGGVISQTSGPNIATARNTLVERFLSESRAPWMAWVDTDMIFDGDVLDRLLEHADPVKAPIVGAVCFSLGDEGILQPTVFDLVPGDDGSPSFVRYDELPEGDVMLECFGTGSAMVVIHRSVFERIRDYPHPGDPSRRGFSDAFPWYQEVDFYGRVMSEDITFCLRANTVGCSVHVRTGVNTSHVKSVVLDRERYDAQRRLIEHQRAREEERDATTQQEGAFIMTDNNTDNVHQCGSECARIAVVEAAERLGCSAANVQRLPMEPDRLHRRAR